MSVLPAIESALRERLGLRPAQNAAGQRRALQQGLERTCARTGLSPEALAARLPNEPGLCLALADGVTIDESYFFRQPEDFNALIAAVTARLTDSGRKHRPVTVWSAGCASGEEPYSMAIAIHRALGHSALSQVRIIATDASAAALAEARAGVYGLWSFRGVPPEVRQRYFEQPDGGQLRVVSRIRQAVCFEHDELRARAARFEARHLDAVFFRNVAIYLTDEATRTMHREFDRVLTPQGLLACGRADPRPEPRELPDLRMAHGRRTPQPPRRAATRSIAREPAATAPRPITARRPQAREDAAALAQRAVALADRGRVTEALEIVDGLLARQGHTASLFALRGQLHMAERNLEAAVQDLRRALYLQDDPLVRFHYANGLKLLHRLPRCHSQLLDVLQALSSLADDQTLSDGQTTAASLRRATDELLRRIA